MSPLNSVVVGHGLAGRSFHAPLIVRQPDLRLHGFVSRSAESRAEASAIWGVRAYEGLDDALNDPEVHLVVLATPHDLHAAQAVRVLEAGKHCVVDKVMALSGAEADAMLAARDQSGRMLSVFHNRRWDWDYLTLKQVLASGAIGRLLVVESSVCRFAPPRTWRGRAAEAGTILHDWGAHLIDQALGLGLGPCRRLTAWLTPAPWEGVDSGGHGRIVLEFDDTLVSLETSRVCRLDRPRWWALGTMGGFVKIGLDPQEDALRAGRLDSASEPPGHKAVIRREARDGAVIEEPVETVRGSWGAYYDNIADHLLRGAPLAVTAEAGREVVRVLDAAVRASQTHTIIEGPWRQL